MLAYRDDFLGHQDCRNIQAGLAAELFQLANSDAQSIRLWVRSHRERVLYYQEYTADSDDSSGQPLILCIQDPWQLQMMLQHGGKAVSFDSTFGTNRFKVRFGYAASERPHM